MFTVIFLKCLVVIGVVKCQTWQQEGRKPMARTQSGVVEGVAVYTDSSKIINSFLGIPYAAPPLGKLRFSPPNKHPGWNGTFQATNVPPRCPQLPIRPGITDIEDCLHLNVWAPPNERNYAPLPVIVFFEGLDFFKSSSISISGQDLASEGFIVVTVNYRLNVFGFFCLGTPQARGNLGILDQYFALLWVRDNIKQFGGDPEKVTLFGHQSGAVSVILHMISPRTLGYFKRVIISSGSALAPWQVDNDPTVASKEVIRLVGCDSNTLDVIGCFRNRTVTDILQALQEYSESNLWTDKFLPVVDTFLPENARYLPVDPSIALKEGNFPQVPILTGITRPLTFSEIGEWSDLASQGFSQFQQYMERAKIPEIMRLYRFDGPSKDDLMELVKWKYASSSQGDIRDLFDQLKNLEFEAKMEAPHFQQLSHLITSYVQPIFAYYIGDLGIDLNTTDHLATSDLVLLFGPILLKQIGRRRFNNNEMGWSAHIKQMWKNFVIVGNPTLNNGRSNSWRKYTASDPYIEYFQTAEVNVNEEVKKRNKRITFWNLLLPKIAQHRNFIANNIPKELQNSPDPAAGFRHAMYTLVALVLALMALLVICIILLKKRSKERERHIHLGY